METKPKHEPTHPHDQNKPFDNNVVNNNINDDDDLFNDISKKDLHVLNSFPCGYRFDPTDDELILDYLQKKVSGQRVPRSKIWSVDLYLFHPEHLIERLCEKHAEEATEDAWYFFTPRNRKYPNGTRPNRAAEGGYWKATGADKLIGHGVEKKNVVGYRKALVFYEGGAQKGAKTKWIMHEYRVNEPPRNKINAEDMKLDDWVLCKLHKKVDKSARKARDDGEPKHGIVDDANWVIPDDSNLNELINFDEYSNGDSGDILFNPPMHPSHYGVDYPFDSLIDPQYISNQIDMQSGYNLWDTNNSERA